MGAEKHYIYIATDGGRIWTQTDSDINKIYDRMLSGAGFMNEKTGFLCFRNEYIEFNPAICMTNDGGLTWNKLHIDILEEYETYNMTVLSPLYDGVNIIMPVQLSDDSEAVETIYIISRDCGKTWEYVKK
jgi:hypothetical protein